MITRLTLVGNPNTGKTTLFNTLTGANEKASNWHGVTVGVKSKSYNYLGNEFQLKVIQKKKKLQVNILKLTRMI